MRFNETDNNRRSLPSRIFLLVSRTALVAVVSGFFCLASGLEPFQAGGKWGFREAGSGTMVVPPVFDMASGFQDGLAPVMLLGKWGYVDAAGQMVLEPEYLEARPFSGGAADVRLADGQWAVIDKAGGIIRLSPSPALGVESEGFVLFARNGKFGYMNKDGKTVIAADFEGAGLFKGGLAPAKKGKWGYINRSGEFRIKPEFDAARDFSEELAAFSKDNRWGFLDKKGRVAVGANFHDAQDFSGGLAAVRLNSKWGYIDKKGLISICPEYDEARSFSGDLAVVVSPVLAPKDSVAPVVLERRWINKKAETIYISSGPAEDGMEVIISTWNKLGYARNSAPVVAPQYEASGGCADGICLVKKDGKYAFIDYSGNTKYKTGFEEASALGCGLYRFRKDMKYGLIGSTGTMIVPAVYDVLEGSGCADRLNAVLNGEAGELDAAGGLFTVGRAVPAAPAVKLSERCLQVEKTAAGMPYNDLPGYCGAAELREILKTSTECVSCRLALAVIYSSPALAGTTDTGAALEALGEAIKLSTDTLRLYQWRTELLLSSAPVSAHAAELIADYKQLIVMEPANPAHGRDLCSAYVLSSSPPAAAELTFASYYCEKAVKLEPSAGNYVILGNFKRLLGDAAGAMEAYRAAVSTSPADASARLARARFSVENGQDFRAVFDYSRVLETDKDNPEVLEERGLAYIRMGACAKALADLEHAGKIRPGPGNIHKLAAYHWRCEKDTVKTLQAAEDLLKMGEQCGGSCWRPAEQEKYLSDFYMTPDYQNLLKKYQTPVPAAPPAGAETKLPI